MIPTTTNLPPDVRKSLVGEACREMAARAAPGFPVYPLICAVVGWSTPLIDEQPWVVATATGLSGVVSMLRFRQNRRLEAEPSDLTEWRRQFGVYTMAALAIWACFTAYTIIEYGMVRGGFLAIMVSLAISATGMVGYNPWLALSRGTVIMQTFTMVPALLLHIGSEDDTGNRTFLTVAIGVVVYSLYLLRQSKILHLQFWRQLEAVKVAEQHAAALQVSVELAEQHAEELDRARVASEVASKAKDEFIANVSHEIRTPLNAVLGLTDLMLTAKKLEGETLADIKTIHEAGKTLVATVNDLLDFAKLDDGGVALHSEHFDLGDSVESALGLFAATAKQSATALLADAKNAVGPVEGDPDRYRQVLSNLISNAIKFTRGGSITVRTRRLNGGVMLRTEVQDTGLGIDPQAKSRLFDPFYQVDGSTTRAVGGTGLGLSICKKIVEAMEGSIGVESVVGEGSTFWFTVPLPEAQDSRRSSIPPIAQSFSGITALLVEDNAVNRIVATKMLERLGIATRVAENGEEAVKLALDSWFDVILMDCQMPIMDGYEASRIICKARAEQGPIVAVTAHAFESDRQRCREAGMEFHLAKPLQLDALRETVADALATLKNP